MLLKLWNVKVQGECLGKDQMKGRSRNQVMYGLKDIYGQFNDFLIYQLMT